jgi:hypothetical protein
MSCAPWLRLSLSAGNRDLTVSTCLYESIYSNMSHFSQLMLLILVPIILRPALCLIADNPLTQDVSIDSDPGYITERACGQTCLYAYGIDVDVASFIGCASENGCFCRGDFGTSVSSFLNSCVGSRCSTDSVPNTAAEITTAISIYNHYCSTAVGAAFVSLSTAAVTAGPAASSPSMTVATTTDAGIAETAQGSSGASSTTGQSVPAQTDGGTPPTSSHRGLSQSDKIAIGVGLGMGLPSIAIGLWTIWRARKKPGRSTSKGGVGQISLSGQGNTAQPSSTSISTKIIKLIDCHKG